MTWCLEGSAQDDGYEALLTLEFQENPNGTELILIHDKLPVASIEMYAAGWSEVLDSLSRRLDLTSADTLKPRVLARVKH